MRKFLILVMTLFFCFSMAGAAMAVSIPITPFGLNTPYGNNISTSSTYPYLNELDWLPGSGLAVDANAVGPGGGSTIFEFLAQLKLGGIITTGGTNVTRPTLNGLYADSDPTPYEFTAITRIWESATGLGGFASTFDLASDPTGTNPNMLEIYADRYDGTAAWGDQASIAAGTGFRDGTLILTATPVALDGVFNVTDQNGNGIPDNQDAGTGSAQVLYHVDSYDAAFWTFFAGAGGLPPEFVLVQFDGTLTLPPDGVETAQMWDGTVPDYFTGDADGTTPWTTNDLFFKVDGNMHFAPIPEPASLLLLGVGLLGMGVVARRRLHKDS